LFICYIGIRGALQPDLCPALPASERVSLKGKIKLLKAVILPGALILAVLGSIYTGAATPTEAAAVGALGAFICAAIHRRLNFKTMQRAVLKTFKLTGMVLWIVGTATAFNALYMAMGAQQLILDMIVGLAVSPWLIILGMHAILFFMGMVVDDYAIILLCGPIFTPIAVALGFDPLWFGITFILNIKTAYLTPPFGFNLFYMKGVAPEGTTMGHIYRSAIPFVGLQLVTLVMVMAFPWMATSLPNRML
jgi:tripartite ATP-independent transporter DctM subunit